MTVAERKRGLRSLARRALRDAEQMAPLERADLFEIASTILSGDESAAAKLAAFSLRESERHQLKFKELLRS